MTRPPNWENVPAAVPITLNLRALAIEIYLHDAGFGTAEGRIQRIETGLVAGLRSAGIDIAPDLREQPVTDPLPGQPPTPPVTAAPPALPIDWAQLIGETLLHAVTDHSGSHERYGYPTHRCLEQIAEDFRAGLVRNARSAAELNSRPTITLAGSTEGVHTAGSTGGMGGAGGQGDPTGSASLAPAPTDGPSAYDSRVRPSLPVRGVWS